MLHQETEYRFIQYLTHPKFTNYPKKTILMCADGLLHRILLLRASCWADPSQYGTGSLWKWID
jgi:hypothetical protein